MRLPVKVAAVRGLLKELSTASGDARPIAVEGLLADVLAKELARGGDPGAVRVGGPDGAAVYVRVLDGDDEEALKRARRAKAALVAVSGDDRRVPYVLATDVVRLEPGHGFPVEEIAAVIARRLGEDGTALAARLPVLRRPVCEQLIRSFARKDAVVGAAVFVPGADLPLLALNQLRLVLRIAAAYDRQIDRERLPEIAGTLGAGFGLRALARELLDLVPVAGWAVKGVVAYAGTRALGEAAVRYFESTSSAHGSESARADPDPREDP